MTTHTIKRSDMVRLGACKSGLAMHDRFAKDQGNNSEDTIYPDGWTWLHTAWLYQVNARSAYWMEENNLIPINDIPDPDVKAMVEKARAALKKPKA